MVKQIANELVVDEKDVIEMNQRLGGDTSLNVTVRADAVDHRPVAPVIAVVPLFPCLSINDRAAAGSRQELAAYRTAYHSGEIIDPSGWGVLDILFTDLLQARPALL